MRSLYTQSYTTVFPTTDIYRKILFLFFLLSVSVIAFYNTNGSVPTTSQLIFRNAVLQSGTAGADGAVYRFYRVDKNIDVLVKITGRSDKKVQLMNIDMTGNGMFAHALDPIPTNFTDQGAIAMLRDTCLFWRISKGGPGLPDEGGPWDTAMPVWEKFLTEEEMWEAILFLYDFSGQRPRAKEEGH